MEKSLAKKKKKRALWTNFILAGHFQKNTDICRFKKKKVTFPTITRLTQQHDSNNLSNIFFLRGKLKKHL